MNPEQITLNCRFLFHLNCGQIELQYLFFFRFLQFGQKKCGVWEYSNIRILLYGYLFLITDYSYLKHIWVHFIIVFSNNVYFKKHNTNQCEFVSKHLCTCCVLKSSNIVNSLRQCALRKSDALYFRAFAAHKITNCTQKTRNVIAPSDSYRAWYKKQLP